MFGFGKGKIEIALEKMNFKPGETIKGKVLLKMKKPTKGKALKIFFIGEKTVTVASSGISSRHSGFKSSVSVGGIKRSGTTTRKEVIHRFEMDLAGEKEYTDSEYPFEIAIPEGVLGKAGELPEGKLGTAIKAIQFLSASANKIEWNITAKLDLEKCLDINKKVQINVG